MTPSDFVPTIETCKVLEKLGIISNSYYIWREYKDGSCNIVTRNFLGEPCNSIYTAPIVEELFVKVPPHICKVDWCGIQPFRLSLAFKEYDLCYGADGSKKTFQISHKHLVEALAQMLIWLRKEKYI